MEVKYLPWRNRYRPSNFARSRALITSLNPPLISSGFTTIQKGLHLASLGDSCDPKKGLQIGASLRFFQGLLKLQERRILEVKHGKASHRDIDERIAILGDSLAWIRKFREPISKRLNKVEKARGELSFFMPP